MTVNQNDQSKGNPSGSQAQPGSAGEGITRRKLRQAEVNKAIKLHQDYRNGVFGGRRAVFSFHDLDGLLLAGCDLSDADFTSAGGRQPAPA
jgi:hypothetical protein